MDDHQIEAHLMSAGSGLRYFCTRTNKSSLQFRENHPETITPPPPNAVVPTLCSCGNTVFLGHHTRTRPSTRFKKKRLSSDQCTLCHDLILHHICSRAHWSLDVLSVADALSVSSTKPCIVQTSVDGPYDNAPVDNPSTSRCLQCWMSVVLRAL
jgi:hypothetical protein